jgi:hypothetical protein
VNTIYEDDEDDEYSSEGSPLTPPVPPSSNSTHPSQSSGYTPGHLISYPQHSNASASAVTKAEGELAKIEEEDELYSDTNDENEDDDNDDNDNYNNDTGGDKDDDDDDEEDGRLFLSNTHNTQVPTPVWRDWTDALSVGSRDRNWLMKSLLLISELCRGNFRAQKKSAHFLPPELLLSLLQSGKLSDQNRSVT